MRFLSILVGLGLFLGLSNAHATASSVVQTIYTKQLQLGAKVRVVQLAVTASSVDGSVADVSVPNLHGFLMKAQVKPGTTNPTASYSVALIDPDSSLDILVNQLGGLSASAAKLLYPVGSTGFPMFVNPNSYTLHITGNSVDSAGTTIWLYMIDRPGISL